MVTVLVSKPVQTSGLTTASSGPTPRLTRTTTTVSSTSPTLLSGSQFPYVKIFLLAHYSQGWNALDNFRGLHLVSINKQLLRQVFGGSSSKILTGFPANVKKMYRTLISMTTGRRTWSVTLITTQLRTPGISSEYISSSSGEFDGKRILTFSQRHRGRKLLEEYWLENS